MVNWLDSLPDALSPDTAFVLAVAVLVGGLLVSYAVWRWTHALFKRLGIADAVEGTTFDRTVQRFGTSTAGVVGLLLAASVYAVALLIASNIIELVKVDVSSRVAELLPQLLIATFAVIIGLVVGDKAELTVQERLRSVKLPEASLIPEMVKYSIFYVAALIALAQVGIATTALLVLLAAYAFGIVFLGGIAFKDLLAAGAAGIYLLLAEPYSIGDEVRIDDKRGIVQEVDMFVTRVEADGEEHIIPNQQVFRAGIIRIRDT
jgi:small-conductance mechanosensitive channel